MNSLNVPLRKITRFYIESRFIGTIHDQLEKIFESLKNSIFVTLDLLSLTRFNLENIPEDLPDKLQIITPVINDTCQKIEKEEEKIREIKESIIELIDSSLEEVFDKLSAYKIPETVSEYSWFIREHQSKKVQKTFYAYLDQLKSSFKNLTTRVLYSRSEWILLAKKILESDKNSTVNQKILDLIELVSPKAKVIDDLPQFYKNLFGGRSSISEDFWIRRERDENMFRTGVSRNNAGHHGGIMIIGDRNSGKTAFCRYITERLFKKEKICHLFPVYTGSVKVSDFLAELGKVTDAQGSLHEIMECCSTGNSSHNS